MAFNYQESIYTQTATMNPNIALLDHFLEQWIDDINTTKFFADWAYTTASSASPQVTCPDTIGGYLSDPYSDPRCAHQSLAPSDFADGFANTRISCSPSAPSLTLDSGSDSGTSSEAASPYFPAPFHDDSPTTTSMAMESDLYDQLDTTVL